MSRSFGQAVSTQPVKRVSPPRLRGSRCGPSERRWAERMVGSWSRNWESRPHFLGLPGHAHVIAGECFAPDKALAARILGAHATCVIVPMMLAATTPAPNTVNIFGDAASSSGMGQTEQALQTVIL